MITKRKHELTKNEAGEAHSMFDGITDGEITQNTSDSINQEFMKAFANFLLVTKMKNTVSRTGHLHKHP